ncbi:MAG: hypothetical protein HY789_13125 [Deltaproteobacteria bacterium]|nr:hypothetical protein [Deltaproteobacteria bacterium]
MALLDTGNLLKGSAKFTLWGLGIYVGLCVAAPLLTSVAKPLAKEVGRGYNSLLCRLKRAEHGEPSGEQAEEEIEIAEQATAAAVGETVESVSAAEVIAVPALIESLQAEPPSSEPVPLAKLKKPRKPAAKESEPSAKWSKAALYAKAKELKIDGRSTMSKEELITALQAAISA